MLTLYCASARPFSTNGTSQIISVGSNLTLQCDGWSYPAPTVTWYVDDLPLNVDGSRVTLDSYTRPIVGGVTLIGGLLTIRDVTTCYTGNYTCHLANDNDYAFATSNTPVFVQGGKSHGSA